MDYGKFGDCLEGRLYAIRKNKKLNQEEFGKRIGVTRSAICNYEGGTRPIGEQVILAVCREFKVNEIWMRHGVGKPYNHPVDGVINQLIEEYQCSKFEGDFLKTYFQMDDNERLIFIKCIYQFIAPLVKNMEGKNPFAYYFDVTTAEGRKVDSTEAATVASAHQKKPIPVSEDGQDELEEFVRKHKANLTAGQQQKILEMMQAMIATQKPQLSASAQQTVDKTFPKTECPGQS